MHYKKTFKGNPYYVYSFFKGLIKRVTPNEKKLIDSIAVLYTKSGELTSEDTVSLAILKQKLIERVERSKEQSKKDSAAHRARLKELEKKTEVVTLRKKEEAPNPDVLKSYFRGLEKRASRKDKILMGALYSAYMDRGQFTDGELELLAELKETFLKREEKAKKDAEKMVKKNLEDLKAKRAATNAVVLRKL